MKKNKITKSTILALVIMLTSHTLSFAQCDKTIMLTASSTSYLNDKNVVERTKDEESIVVFDKKEITVTTDGNHLITGAVKTYTCNWPTPYKTGKTVITTKLTDGGRDMNATITIEGKDGKVVLTFEALEMPGKKIQLVADKLEIKS